MVGLVVGGVRLYGFFQELFQTIVLSSLNMGIWIGVQNLSSSIIFGWKTSCLRSLWRIGGGTKRLTVGWGLF